MESKLLQLYLGSGSLLTVKNGCWVSRNIQADNSAYGLLSKTLLHGYIELQVTLKNVIFTWMIMFSAKNMDFSY